MSAAERRIARDGAEYSKNDFLAWYGDIAGHQYWQEAKVAGAPQTGGPGAPHPGGQGAPSCTHPGVIAVQPIGTVSASQPGGSPWEGSLFLTQTLRQNHESLRQNQETLHLAKTPREAIDKAYALADYLPLPVQAFVNFNILLALDATGGAGQPAEESVEAVVAEKIPRIPDNNRPPSCRVDFFVYCRNGDVIRHPPGRTARSSMHPHRMPSGSLLFSLAQARDVGVGASLHLHPPGRPADAAAPQPGVVLCTRSAVDESCPYDVHMMNWRRVREILLQPRQEETQVDISDGHLFPWWLLMRWSSARPLLDRGVTRVVASGRTFVVTLLDGEVTLYSDRHQLMKIHENIVA